MKQLISLTLISFLFISSTVFALPNNELEELKAEIQKILKENQVPRHRLVWSIEMV